LGGFVGEFEVLGSFWERCGEGGLSHAVGVG